MMSALEQLLSTPEGRRELCIARTITNVTEMLCEQMEQHGFTQTDLAKALGVTPGRVSQMLDGSANLTLTSVARALAVFDVVMEPATSPLVKQTGE